MFYLPVFLRSLFCDPRLLSGLCDILLKRDQRFVNGLLIFFHCVTYIVHHIVKMNVSARVEYTQQEYAEMHYLYGYCDGNARAAAREYCARYPNRNRFPDYRVFIRVHNAYSEGRLPGQQGGRDGRGRPQVQNVQQENRVMLEIRRDRTGGENRSGYSDEEYESDPGTKVKGAAKLPRDESESDGSFNPSGSEEEVDSDFDPEGGESASGGSRKRRPGRRRSSAQPAKRGRKPKGKGRGKGKPTRGRKARSDSGDESEASDSESDDASGSDADDSDEPKAKRGKAVAAKGRKPVAKGAKATPVKRKAPEPAKKKPAGKPVGRPAKKARKASDEESGEGSDEDGDEDDDEPSDEDDDEQSDESDAPADKKKKRPPTDDEIKKYVKQILEGANLEEITMKTVCKQVYSHYPDFDLAHKKDFIKATVKSCI